MKAFLTILKNKYLLTVVALIVWLSFFDKNDFSTQMELSKKVQKLESERDYYIKAIAETKKEITELQTDSANLEKFARENYLMKRDNEDVFVIVKK
jgi:cell division protein FtsB